ncbi:MAG: leucine--tRNA ligase [Fervidicoccaceae archaeon]
MSKYENFSDFDNQISKKWRTHWEETRIYESEPVKGKEKFFLTAAYPYTNGPLHLGHARTYLIPDIVARYKRMRGINVLFPMGFHFTGTPILTATEALLTRDENLLREYRELYEVDEEDIERIKSPLDLAKYFKKRAENDMKNYLLSIDWRRQFTTVDEEYKSFIRWQFLKLKERNYIVRGTHPVGWCPVHQMPVGMHDTKGDVEPEIQELTLIYFLSDDGLIFPAATLRPETIFGAVNVWVNPKGKYTIARIEGKVMVLSKEAFFKITFQKKDIEILVQEINGKELIGRVVENPVTGKKIPVLPATFVDVSFGTGIVMSVPAHAPYDYVALIEIMESDESFRGLKISPVRVISLRGYEGNPAEIQVKLMGIKSTAQKELLDRATKELYLKEFNDGVMDSSIVELSGNDLVREFAQSIAGKTVKESRESVIDFLKRIGKADSFYEIANRPVYCRCGNEIVVKILENQWFIDYENEQWKSEVKRALNNTIEIIPSEYRSWFMNVVDWLKKRACARTRGMGTPLPWDERWVIESLSDSTIYMAFYTVIHKIKELNIPAGKLDESFWDYVFLGRGDSSELAGKLGVSAKKLEEMRDEFLYWYPLDNRHSAKDLVPNHLTFMVFNHVAIFPEQLWPRRIVVNGHIMVEGEKMSKSLGNFIPLFKAMREVGPNSLRLAIAYSAEIGNDANYSRDLIPVVHERLRKIAELIEQISQHVENDGSEGIEEKWIKSTFRRRVASITENMEKYQFRNAAIGIYFLMEQDLRRYISMKSEPNWKLLRNISEEWIKMMAPITPAFAEELWHEMGMKGSVTLENWPVAEQLEYYPQEEIAFILLEKIKEDIENVKGALKKEPKEIVIVTASRNKQEVSSKVFAMLEEGAQMKDLMKEIGKSNLGVKPQDATIYLYEFYQSLPEDLRKFVKENKFDEIVSLKGLVGILEKEVGCRVKILSEDDNEAVQFISRRKPIPFRPSINLII